MEGKKANTDNMDEFGITVQRSGSGFSWQTLKDKVQTEHPYGEGGIPVKKLFCMILALMLVLTCSALAEN